MVVFFAAALPAAAQDSTLGILRQDVHGGAPSQPAAAAPSSGSTPRASDGQDQTYDGNLFLATVLGAGIVASSPLWVPLAILQDDSFSSSGYFRRFPYDGGPDYIKTDGSTTQTKPFAVRLDVEYVDTFDRLDVYGGHLLVETAPRFGLAVSANRWEEHLSSGGWDQLQVGDCNFVYRFAQGGWGEFRTGLGLNWLNDSHSTDLGFNFHYAADFYPQNPWVLSSEIDAGTLGHAGLFQFRTTLGVVFHGVEVYTGYEYTDIGRTHWNGLIGGLRFWF
jgi:hypothetical protein